jgi:hypothetical protein
VFGWKVGKSGKGAEPTGAKASGKNYFALYGKHDLKEGLPLEIAASQVPLQFGCSGCK